MFWRCTRTAHLGPDMEIPKLTFRSLRTTAVSVPMKHVLGTSAQTIRSAPLLLVDLETEEGATGHTYVWCYVPEATAFISRVLEDLARIIKGNAVDPAQIVAKLGQRFSLIGTTGIIGMALSALDVVCWDALSAAAEMPLAEFLGGVRTPIPAYNSNGLGLMVPEACADEAEELLEGGFRAVKLRLGYPNIAGDLAAVRAVRKRLPDGVQVMADYNQVLTRNDAITRCASLDQEGLTWIEEPIRHDDYVGCASLAKKISTPIQIGENFYGPHAMQDAIQARASDLMMPDLCRIGGVTGWLAAASLAANAEIKLSSHLFPEVSVHLLSVSPTCHWLEYVDWASTILAEPFPIVDGKLTAPNRPGTGMSWNLDAVEKCRLS
jgi:mandelate racemase